MPTHVAVIEHSGGFLAIRDEWNALLRTSRVACPFLTWEWLYSWWMHLGGTGRLHIVTVRRGGELVALAPLVVTRGLPAWMSRLEFMGTGCAGSDYLDFIIREGAEDDALGALAEHLRARMNVLRLDHVHAAGSFAEAIMHRLAGNRWTVSKTPHGICPFIRLDGHTWDSLLGTLGSSHRANVRRRLRAIDANYETHFNLVGTEAERQEALPALIRLHNARWTDRGGSSAFQAPATRAFHDDVTRLALDAGWLRLYVLTLNGAIAAVQYLFAFGGRSYFYQHGYDAAYNQQSVGLVSFALAIRAAIDERATEFDMLWGNESYKDLWSNEARALVLMDLFPPDTGGVIQRRAIDADLSLRTLAKRVLGRTHGRRA